MRIGIDLGGTKIEGLVLDSGGVEKARLRVPTPGTSYEETLKAVIDVVGELERRAGERCTLGLAPPGAVAPATRPIKNANSTRPNDPPPRAAPPPAPGRGGARQNDTPRFSAARAR